MKNEEKTACIKSPSKEILYTVQQLPIGGNTLTRNKVEICGVDTAKLPVLKMMKCVNYFVKCKVRDKRKREISEWKLTSCTERHPKI